MPEPGRASTRVSNSSSTSVLTFTARARALFPAGSTASKSSTRTPSESSSPVREGDGRARPSSPSALRLRRDLRRALLWCVYAHTPSVAAAIGPGCSQPNASRCIGRVGAAVRLRTHTRTSETSRWWNPAQPARLELALLDPQVAREFGLVSMKRWGGLHPIKRLGLGVMSPSNPTEVTYEVKDVRRTSVEAPEARAQPASAIFERGSRCARREWLAAPLARPGRVVVPRRLTDILLETRRGTSLRRSLRRSRFLRSRVRSDRQQQWLSVTRDTPPRSGFAHDHLMWTARESTIAAFVIPLARSSSGAVLPRTDLPLKRACVQGRLSPHTMYLEERSGKASGELQLAGARPPWLATSPAARDPERRPDGEGRALEVLRSDGHALVGQGIESGRLHLPIHDGVASWPHVPTLTPIGGHHWRKAEPEAFPAHAAAPH